MNEQGYLKIFLCSKHKRTSSSERLHRHKGWSLFYIITGSAHVAILQNHKERTIDIQPGEFVFLSSLIPHRLRISDADNCYMIHLALSPCDEKEGMLPLKQLKESSEDAYKMLLNPALLTHASDMTSMLSNTLIEILLNYEPSRKDATLSAITGLMLRIMLMEIFYLGKQGLEPLSDRYVNKAVAYLKGQSTDVVRVADVAAAVGIHPVYLQRVFKERMNMSMMTYLVQYRIQRACRLLCTTRFSIIDIALDCGFTNRQHFTRCFKERKGMTPSEYRRQKQIGLVDTEIDYEETVKPGDRIVL